MIRFIGNQLILPTTEGQVRLRNFHIEADRGNSIGSIACIQSRELLRVSLVSPERIPWEFTPEQIGKYTNDASNTPDQVVNEARLAAKFLQKMFKIEDAEPGFLHP